LPDTAIGKMAANYFIEKGYTNLAFLGNDTIFWSKLRAKAYSDECLLQNKKFYKNPDWNENASWEETINSLALGCKLYQNHWLYLLVPKILAARPLKPAKLWV